MATKSGKRSSERRVFNQAISFEIYDRESKVKNVRIDGFGVDISSNGIGLTTEYSVKKGDVLSVYLSVNEIGTTLPVFAEVLWVNPVDSSFRAGLRFLA